MFYKYRFHGAKAVIGEVQEIKGNAVYTTVGICKLDDVLETRCETIAGNATQNPEAHGGL